MRRLLMLLALLCLGINECGSLPYRSDVGMMTALEANSFELKFDVNNLACKDLQGSFGKCVLSMREGDDLFLKLYIPPGPGSVRIYVPNRETLNIPFRDQEAPLDIKIPSLTKSQDGTFGISVVLDDATGSLQALIFVTITDRNYLPLESPIVRIDSDKTSVEIEASAYTKYFALTSGDGRRKILEKVNKISFDSEGKPIEVELYSESLRSSYGSH